MRPGVMIIGGLALAAALVIIALVMTMPQEPDRPMVYVMYDAGKGDLSYADSAYRGLFSAQERLPFYKREFTNLDRNRLSPLMKSTGKERPGLVITIGYTFTDETRRLAQENPEIRFLAIDQTGIGAKNVKACEITSYGESYLAGVLAASATKTRNVGIILGTQSPLLEAFRRGFADGVRAKDPSVRVQEAYVRDNSPEGFTDPARGREIAGEMYRNGADVIYLVAGYSNTGAITEARAAPGRYVIGVDSDQTHLGPHIVLASAVKRLDLVVESGIGDYLNGSFTGGDQVVGLRDGVTGLVFNPRFESYNATVTAWEERARAEEAAYIAGRAR